MKNIFVTLLIIFLASCGSAIEGKPLECGSNLNSDKILQTIRQQKDCLNCLLSEVDKELKNCPSDVALNRIAMAVSIRMKRDGNSILQYYESMASSDSMTAEEIAQAAFYYKEKGDLENALKNYEKALVVKDDPFIRYSLAEVQFKHGQKAGAVETLRKLLEMTYPLPKTTIAGYTSGSDDALFDDASIFLAEIYASIGQPENAEVVYRKLLSSYMEKDFHYPDYLLLFSQFLSKSSSPEKIEEAAALKAKAETILLKENNETRVWRAETGRSWLRIPTELLP